MVDWPEDIRFICEKSAIIGGGFEYDGKELAPLDEDAARAFFAELKGKVQSIAISCAFSTVRADHEHRAAEICRQIMGEDVHISISSEIGSMGLIERENATILNAALYQVAERFTEGFAYSLAQEGITNAEVYLSQNDGTLMTMGNNARRYPILTIACGPTNSIRGASYLSHLDNAIVIDVGGTTTDLGVIQAGFPRESGVAVTIGGVRTNFRMPRRLFHWLRRRLHRPTRDLVFTVGPDSVGYKLTEKALVFGGDTLTATDIAVRLGMANIGDAGKVAHISEELARKALDAIRELVEESIDVMKVSSEDIDVILVGGGSILLPETLAGARSVTKPNFFGTANAIGSAISKVSGTYEALIDYNELPRDRALEQAKKEAIEMAVNAGAKTRDRGNHRSGGRSSCLLSGQHLPRKGQIRRRIVLIALFLEVPMAIGRRRV